MCLRVKVQFSGHFSVRKRGRPVDDTSEAHAGPRATESLKPGAPLAHDVRFVAVRAGTR